jgi:hypothetical protein
MIVENLPPELLYGLPQIGLILIGIIVEQHYVSRVTCFTNSLALYVHVGTLTNPGLWLGIYADIGILLGVIGFIAYHYQVSLPNYYYVMALFAYSGLPVALVILSGSQWIGGLLIAVFITLVAVYLAPSDIKFGYTKSIPGSVYTYAEGRTIQYTDFDTGYSAKIDLLDALLN